MKTSEEQSRTNNTLRDNFIRELNKNHQCPKCGYMWKDLELKGEKG